MRFPLSVTMLVLAAAPAIAQQQSVGPIEFGFDASIARISVNTPAGSSSATTIAQFPVQSLRLAIPATPYVSIEPAMAIIYFHADDDSETSFSGEIAALIHFSPDRKKPQFFARPFIGWEHDAFLSGSAGDRANFGAGLGVKVPAGDRFAFRFEGRYRHYNAVHELSANSIGLVVGVSVYTKS